MKAGWALSARGLLHNPSVRAPCTAPSFWRFGSGQHERRTLVQKVRALSDDTASVAPDAQGLIWRTPSTTSTVGRLYLSGYLDMVSYILKHGAPPGSITLYVKMRRIADATRRIPWPAFALVDGSNAYIT